MIQVAAAVQKHGNILQGISFLVFHLPFGIKRLCASEQRKEKQKKANMVELFQSSTTPKRYKTNSALSNIGCQLVNFLQVSAQAIIVKAVAHHKLIGYRKTYMGNRNGESCRF